MSTRDTQQSDTTKTLREVLQTGMRTGAGKRGRDNTFQGREGESGDVYYATLLEKQYASVCGFVSRPLVNLIEQTGNQNATGSYKLLLNLEGMADLLHRHIVLQHTIDEIILARKSHSSVHALQNNVSLMARSDDVCKKLAGVFEVANVVALRHGAFDKLTKFGVSGL